MKRVGQIFRDFLVNRVKRGLDYKTVFVLNYTKLSTKKLTDLRKVLKRSGADVFVSKNTIAALALREMGYEKLADRISNQTAFVQTNGDSVAVSKILIQFEKDSESVKVQGGLLEGKVLVKEDVKRLSELPPREVLLSQLLGTIQAPLSRLAGALNAKTRDLLSILKQLSEKKGGS
ncbi:MAG: 50S ribosomal protein L10 [Candidatus Omnitrophica bacterium]|nr:50S ribosomal protein L10 [Candidatus Omnitrophota bacterium]